MAFMESLWPWLSEFPLVVESCEYDRLHAVLAHDFERVTTHVRLVGAGVDGLGEDVSVHIEDGTSLHETGLALPLAGEWTLAGFCDHLTTLDPWVKPPEWEGARRFRNWAFESAALDLTLRQAGRALHDVLGLEPRPVRFVNSLGLGEPPSIEPVRRRLARSPDVRFKLDAEATWSPTLVEDVAATGAVDTIDFKGHYGLDVKDPEELVALYDRVLQAFPDAYLEDPHDLPEITRRLASGPRGEREAVAHRQPACAVRRVRALRAGAAADVRRRDGGVGRRPRADRAAGRAVPCRRAQRRGAECLQRGRPDGRAAGQPAGTASRRGRFPVAHVASHGGAARDRS
jgi:hypothetical protein